MTTPAPRYFIETVSKGSKRWHRIARVTYRLSGGNPRDEHLAEVREYLRYVGSVWTNTSDADRYDDVKDAKKALREYLDRQAAEVVVNEEEITP